MVVVRELTGGLYYAQPKGRTETPQGIVGVDTMRYTEAEIERVLRVGFELARGRRKKLTSVDKSQRAGNIQTVARHGHAVSGWSIPTSSWNTPLVDRVRHADCAAPGVL